MKYIREVLKLGAPLLAGALVEYIMYIADSVMVGRLGTSFLAAVAVGGMVTEILWAFTWTVAPAVQTFVSRYYGMETTEGDIAPAAAEHTGRVVQTGIAFGLLAGLAALLLSLLSRPILTALIPDPLTVALSMDYVRIIRWSMPVAAVFFAMYGFLSGIGRTRVLMIATIGTNILNIVINYLLIYGKFSLPRMGIRGAALGTLLSQCAGFIFIIVIIVSNRSLKKYRILRFLRNPQTNKGKGLLQGILKAWLPVTLQNISSFCIFLVYEGLLSRFGSVHLAVFHVVFLLTWAGKSISGGFAQGGSILLGNSLGRKETREAVRYAVSCLCIGILTGLCITLLCLITPAALMRVFNPDSETLAGGIRALRFFAFFMFAGTAGYTLEVLFTFNGWGSFVLLADLSSHAIFTIGLSCAAVFLFDAGIGMLWTAYGLYLTVFAVLLLSGFLSMKWTRLGIKTVT